MARHGLRKTDRPRICYSKVQGLPGAKHGLSNDDVLVEPERIYKGRSFVQYHLHHATMRSASVDRACRARPHPPPTRHLSVVPIPLFVRAIYSNVKVE